jgi:spermidine synthase
MALPVLGLLPLVAADPRLPFREGVHVYSFLRVALGVGGFSAAVGFLTPMLVDRWSRGDPRSAGDAYAVNVLGSVIGPLVVGFGLLPWMSERTALLLLVAPLVGLALLTVVRPRALGLAPTFRGIPALTTAAVACLVVPLLSNDFEGAFEVREVRRDATATVIATGEGMDKRLLVNGRGMTLLTPATKMMAHLPLAFLPNAPESGLVVALGMGTSFRSLHSWGVEATVVELVPSVVELLPYYHADGRRLLESPRAHVVVDDGRRFLERTADRYDVLIVDPPPPLGAAGSSLLYSREFFELARGRLEPGGILQQWLYDPSDDYVVRASIAKALAETFPHVRAFGAFEGYGYHLLASDRPIADLQPAELAARVPPPAAADLLEWGPHPTVEGQFAEILAAEISLDEFIAAAPDARPLQDNWAVNEYFWFRERLQELGLR